MVPEAQRRIIVVEPSNNSLRAKSELRVLEGQKGVRLRSTGSDPCEVELCLSNYYSRELFHEKVRIRPEKDLDMDLSQHGEGIYILRLGFPDGKRDERMIIKIER